METATNNSVILDASAPARRAGMTESEWREAIKFDSMDTGWVIMSIGMAIGAGIVFLPVQVGLMGLWVFLLSSIIGYPAMYLFQRLFINTLAESPECKDYPSVISGYLGKNWGILLGALYFVMLVIWMFVQSLVLLRKWPVPDVCRLLRARMLSISLQMKIFSFIPKRCRAMKMACVSPRGTAPRGY